MFEGGGKGKIPKEEKYLKRREEKSRWENVVSRYILGLRDI